MLRVVPPAPSALAILDQGSSSDEDRLIQYLCS